MRNKSTYLRGACGLLAGLFICILVYISTTSISVYNTTIRGRLCGADILYNDSKYPAETDVTGGWPQQSVKTKQTIAANCTVFSEKTPKYFYKLLNSWQFCEDWLIYSGASILVIYGFFALRRR
jgi:hypothetical protein